MVRRGDRWSCSRATWHGRCQPTIPLGNHDAVLVDLRPGPLRSGAPPTAAPDRHGGGHAALGIQWRAVAVAGTPGVLAPLTVVGAAYPFGWAPARSPARRSPRPAAATTCESRSQPLDRSCDRSVTSLSDNLSDNRRGSPRTSTDCPGCIRPGQASVTARQVRTECA
jgi:hypothetical protein